MGFAACVGCQKKNPPQELYHYQLSVEATDVPVGSVVLAGEHELGVIGGVRNGDRAGSGRYYVSIRVPRDLWLSSYAGDLALRIPDPCGDDWRVPVRVQQTTDSSYHPLTEEIEAKQRDYGSIQYSPTMNLAVALELGDRVLPTRSATAFIDGQGVVDATLEIGTMSLPLQDALDLYGLDCKAPVRVNGKTVGTISPQDEPTEGGESRVAKGYVVSLSGPKCYDLIRLVYGTSKYGTSGVSAYNLSPAASVFPIGRDEIDFFLQEPAQSVSVQSEYEELAERWALVVASCSSSES